jgi:hypothetical protein
MAGHGASHIPRYGGDFRWRAPAVWRARRLSPSWSAVALSSSCRGGRARLASGRFAGCGLIVWAERHAGFPQSGVRVPRWRAPFHPSCEPRNNGRSQHGPVQFTPRHPLRGHDPVCRYSFYRPASARMANAQYGASGRRSGRGEGTEPARCNAAASRRVCRVGGPVRDLPHQGSLNIGRARPACYAEPLSGFSLIPRPSPSR